jgi:hypothetical protein
MDSPSITEQAERLYISTGHPPNPETVQELVSDAHRRFKTNTDGQNSQVYPALAKVPSGLFGICTTATPQQVMEAVRVNTESRGKAACSQDRAAGYWLLSHCWLLSLPEASLTTFPKTSQPTNQQKGGEIDLSLRSLLGGLKEKKA